tara:strand:+ start:5441 stop:8569 length:3129 start_codon:yes stop_codon:yes gene_type:complete
MVVSRETKMNFSQVLNLVETSLENVFGVWGLDSGFKNVSAGFLPFLVFLYARKKISPTLLVCNDHSLRISLFEDINHFSKKQCLSFIKSNRSELVSGSDLHAISSFKKHNNSIMVCSEESFDFLKSNFLGLKTENEYVLLSSLKTRGSLVGLLTSLKMDLSDKVFSPGFYSIRGSVVDFFLFGDKFPIRVEFDGEEIFSVRSFSVETQMQIDVLDVSLVKIQLPVEQNLNLKSDSKMLYKSLLIKKSLNGYFSISRYGKTDGVDNDLKCINHFGFRKNPTLLKSLIESKQAEGINNFLICLNPDFSHKIKSKVFSGFISSNVRLLTSFSSSVLGLFFLKLSDVYDIPEIIKNKDETSVKSFNSSSNAFKWKSLVVHENLGVGVYKGLSKVKNGSSVVECVALEYKHGDKVHVPLENLHFLDIYIGNKNEKNITDLRKTSWEREKFKARKSAGEIVDSFVEMYGKRTNESGVAFEKDGELYDELKESFKYTETKDQLVAYQEIKRDMENKLPMDRLLCGDVGFGKTEVAIRSALKALNTDKQVVVLAPTTILSNQLFESFKERLSGFGFNLCQLSRFVSKKLISKYVVEIKSGKIDVVVGTHRVLSKDVKIPKLGLIIIDEEHRFGANHKEKLRIFSNNVDVLSMSATPIPRTMQFALMGIRDITTIKTPPVGRLSVITNQLPFDSSTLKHAALYEKERGGQSFFVFNNVKKIEGMVLKLKNLLPNLSIKYAHGQMKPVDLEKIMNEMFLGKIDLLVCTTIIEAGVDLPNVNTIFIYDAHKYGLSQLYQMRGRVGRSPVQAYCYLLTPNVDLSQEAYERLRTLQYNSVLGSGYNIALRDFEMRGGGNLFGTEQSGHLSNVGLNFYNKMIKEKALLLKSGDMGNEKVEKESVFKISVGGEALIPEDFMENQDDRLFFYRRLSLSTDCKEVDLVNFEIRDRFGLPPTSLRLLFLIKKIRLLSLNMNLLFLKTNNTGVDLLFGLFNKEDVVGLVTQASSFFNNHGVVFSVQNNSTGLTFKIETHGVEKSLSSVVGLLNFLKDENED